jgi:hypothetical protein
MNMKKRTNKYLFFYTRQVVVHCVMRQIHKLKKEKQKSKVKTKTTKEKRKIIAQAHQQHSIECWI